jgi:RecJ-like exonuclease
MTTCQQCQGHGYLSSPALRACPRCDGEGEVFIRPHVIRDNYILVTADKVYASGVIGVGDLMWAARLRAFLQVNCFGLV